MGILEFFVFTVLVVLLGWVAIFVLGKLAPGHPGSSTTSSGSSWCSSLSCGLSRRWASADPIRNSATPASSVMPGFKDHRRTSSLCCHHVARGCDLDAELRYATIPIRATGRSRLLRCRGGRLSASACCRRVLICGGLLGFLVAGSTGIAEAAWRADWRIGGLFNQCGRVGGGGLASLIQNSRSSS